jgi:thiol-disulfide isomerase/thioredoxin
VTAGLVVCLAALVIATVAGLGWRATNGKMRAPRAAPARRAASDLPQASASTDSAATGGAARNGAATNSAATDAAATAGAPRVSSAQLGQPLGERATLVQFSSAFCAPCRATRVILSEVAAVTSGVAHVEIDAESRLDLVRELGVMRTPTVLVLGADGQIVRRASGQPRKADVIGALGLAIEDENSYSSDLEAR